MAKIDYPKAIKSLEFSYAILPKKTDDLSKNDLKTLGEACSLYLKYYESFVGGPVDPRIEDAYSFHKFIIDTEIENLVNKFKEAEEAEKESKQEKPREQEASIPPELESLVAEYRQNQALLESEEYKNNPQKSVALQVKIAIAHSKIRALALANRERRMAKGEKFQDLDNVLVALGSPKSESVTAALSASYAAVHEVAALDENYTNLSPEIKQKIVDQAVELHMVSITNIDVAIQSAALLIDTSELSETERSKLSALSSHFVHSVYDEVNSETKQAASFENRIMENEVVILKLTSESKKLKGEALQEIRLQINTLSENNHQLATELNNLPQKFDTFIKNEVQTSDYQKFEHDNQTRFEKALEKDLSLIDLPDRIKLANKKISDLHNNLEKNGVNPHIYTPMDDAKLLEDAIRHDMPGVLLPHSGYEAEYAAALVNHPKTQDPNLSPLTILLFGKELTPVVFTKVLQFASAKENSGTALGKLFQTRKDIFETTGTQIRKISQSPLGKEILKTTGGLGKVFKSTSKFFGKISDVLGKAGAVFRVVSNPWGAFKSWLGRKIGKIVVNKIINSAAGKIAIQAGKKLAGELLKKGIGKAIVSIATKLGIKAAVALGLSSTVVGAPVALILVVIDVAVGVLKLGSKAVQRVATSIYGEKINARDIVAVPIAGIATATATVVGGVIAFFGALGTATVAAAGSAVAITVTGIIIGIFFYITSIVMAPLISTLVQLESTPLTSYIPFGCAAWPTAGKYILNQGPLGVSTHFTNKLQAVDILANENSGFLAAAPGQVIFSAPLGSYGNAVIVSATAGVGTIQMLYAHMNSVEVSVGQHVEAGDTIGSVGGTGGWTPHIHFEYRGGVEYNSCPAGDIPVPEGCFNNCIYNNQIIVTNTTTP